MSDFGGLEEDTESVGLRNLLFDDIPGKDDVIDSSRYQGRFAYALTFRPLVLANGPRTTYASI